MGHAGYEHRLRVPADVQQDAQQGVALVKRGYLGGTSTGWKRGTQLANNTSISFADALVMRAWFARHVTTSRPSYARWLHAPTAERKKKRQWRGAVAWLLWGGDAAYRWILQEDVQARLVAWATDRGKRPVASVPMRI